MYVEPFVSAMKYEYIFNWYTWDLKPYANMKYKYIQVCILYKVNILYCILLRQDAL
jgi:hypothetical protein